MLYEEMGRIHARSPLQGMGTSMIGPTLLEFGTEEQKQRHVPKIARGEVQWCQGYSEPNAGSDLAALQNPGRGQGRSFPHQRPEDLDVRRRHRGLDVRPGAHRLRRAQARRHQLRAAAHGPARRQHQAHPPDLRQLAVLRDLLRRRDCQKDDLVGELNKGWTVGKRLLQFERSGIGGLTGGARAADPANILVKTAKQYIGEEDGRIADPALRQKILRMNMTR